MARPIEDRLLERVTLARAYSCPAMISDLAAGIDVVVHKAGIPSYTIDLLQLQA